MRPAPGTRRVLHVDLDPFFVAVERTRDLTLRDRPLVIGGMADGGRVAAASEEARARGVDVGQPMALARRLCPTARFRPGDFETYARVSDEVTAVLTASSPRVERPSIDEAFVDLTTTAPAMRHAVAAAEAARDAIGRRLGLDASFGLGSSRLAARMASRWARPRGLLLLLPDHEASFVRRQPLTLLPDLSARSATLLASAGMVTLGDIADAHPPALHALLGRAAAERLRAAIDPELEPSIAPVTAPHFVQEEHVLRGVASDPGVLSEILDVLTLRAARRLVALKSHAAGLTVEVRRAGRFIQRSERLAVDLRDVDLLPAAARRVAAPLIEPAFGVRTVRVRLTSAAATPAQYALFQAKSAAAR